MMSRSLVLLFIIFQTPLLQATTDCKDISQEKSQEATQALLEEMAHFEPNYLYLHKIKCLIEAGADVNAKGAKGEFGAGDTALMHASQSDRVETVEVLIDAGADVDAKNEFGSTALMYASQWGHKEVVEILIKSGADVNAKGHFESTALIYASQGHASQGKGHKEIVEMLINAGADVDAKSSSGNTALMVASLAGHKEIIKILEEAQ